MKRAKYTRKHVKDQKFNPKNDPDVSLHRIMNRIDVEKDAYFCSSYPVERNRALLNTHIDLLFGPLPKSDYTRSLEYLELLIEKHESIDNNEIVVDTYNEKIYHNILPKFIQYGIQDAGLSPQRYDKHIKTLITPGSYLDPAKRSSAEGYFGFDRVLQKRDFVNIGMHTIYKLSPVLRHDKSCTIVIEFVGNHKISTHFSYDFKPIHGDTQYFKGNYTKNKYIDSNEVNSIDLTKFVLCKELGDTMQAVYGKLCADEIPDGNKRVCLFTNDNILTLRCKLIQLQVVYNVMRGKNEKTIHHYPTMSYVTEAYIEMWRENIKAHNTFVIQNISNILKEERYYLVNGRMISFTHNNTIKHILNKYIIFTNNSTIKFLSLRAETMPLNTYRRLSIAHHLPRLFFGNILNSTAISVQIFTDADRIALTTGESTLMRGGGDTLPGIAFETEEDDYTVDRIYTDDDIPSVKTKHTLYTLMRDHFTNKNTLCYVIEGISSMLGIFFGYVGMSTYNEDFLKYVVEAYDKNMLGRISPHDFEQLFLLYLKSQEQENTIIRPSPSPPHQQMVMRTVDPVRRRGVTRRKARSAGFKSPTPPK